MDVADVLRMCRRSRFKEGEPMRTLIYYFTGTGNSLAVARDLAGRMDAELVSIVGGDCLSPLRAEADRIGFVFPVYHQGPPVAVARFVARLEELGKKSIFVIYTYGDSPGIALERFAKTIADAGGRLSGGLGVRMPYNYIMQGSSVANYYKAFILRETSLADQKELFWIWEHQRETILQELEDGEGGSMETDGKDSRDLFLRLDLRYLVQKSLWLKRAGYEGEKPETFDEGIALMDHGFWSDEKCTGCGTCSRVCPVGNISMVRAKPVWNHQCEQCFACLHWCPQEALQFGEATEGRSRYHHPDVTILDILSRLQLAEVELGIGEGGGADI